MSADLKQMRVFRRSDGLVVHVLVPGYECRKRRSPQLRDRQALCGAPAWRHTNGEAVDVGLPIRPGHLRWCAKCVGLLAELRGRIDELAAELTCADREQAGHQGAQDGPGAASRGEAGGNASGALEGAQSGDYEEER